THLIRLVGIDVLERAEVAGQGRSTELVVVAGRADRTLEHDVERRDDPSRFACAELPWLRIVPNFEVRRRETSEAGFRLGTASDRPFVTYLAARARRCSGIRRNGSRVVGGVHLHQDG